MTDTLTREARSERMRLIKSKNTRPELLVRRLCREIGFAGYRLHRRDLPGRPDLAFIGRKKALFVHGCFWHGHDCRNGNRPPKDNRDYWTDKLTRNKVRDATHLATLTAQGWRSLVIWECELKAPDRVSKKIFRFLNTQFKPHAATLGKR